MAMIAASYTIRAWLIALVTESYSPLNVYLLRLYAMWHVGMCQTGGPGGHFMYLKCMNYHALYGSSMLL